MATRDILVGEYMNDEAFARHEEVCAENLARAQSIRHRVLLLPKEVQDEVFSILVDHRRLYSSQHAFWPVLHPKVYPSITPEAFAVFHNEISIRTTACGVRR